MTKNVTFRTVALMMVGLACLFSSLSANAFTDNFTGGRTDFRDETIYFAITTRFYDGDETNNVLCWDNQNAQISTKDPCWRGDFQGLIDKLDYIKALGFTAIWITPIVQNASGYDYHGYHAMDFSKVDLRYESRKAWGASKDVTFQSLIDAAHAKGLKIILDVVLQHTGNFGENYFCKLFERDQNIRNQANIEACMHPTDLLGGASYWKLDPNTQQYPTRFKYLKNTDGQNHDNHNYWHHVANAWNWDDPSRWWGQIAGDCVDLNTENPAVTDYIVKCYGEFIKMGVDGFRIDTSGHIARLSFNAAFIPKFLALGEQYKSKRLNNCPFYMFGEVCARFQGSATYRDQPNLSPYYYTWKSTDALVNEWKTYDAAWWDKQFVKEGAEPLGNMLTCLKEANTKQTSNNALMQNGQYHTPDYSQASGFYVIDFPMHYSFNNAGQAIGLAGDDKYYNDATYNVVYVDSHDYSPGPNDGMRFNGGTAQWAENLSLMFTFRGIPCLYYGSEVEFMAGAKIDNGPNGPLNQTGRAYFGEYLKGNVTATDFGTYTASGNVNTTLNGDLSQHIIRLNQIRAKVPALRKGQYTFDGCQANGGYAFKRHYKSGSINSYALVCINGGATFTGVLNGTYKECVTGETKTVSDGKLTATCSGKGNLRVWVLNGPGKVGTDGKFIYGSSSVAKGGNPKFTDTGATRWYGKEDAVAGPSVTLNPNGGSFKSETQTVTATLSETAASGWYRVGNGSKVNLTKGKTESFTIGKEMKYGESVTVSWEAKGTDGTASNGSAVFKKVDPNATITVYVAASVAPYLYAWTEKNGSTTELNGGWPGKQMTATETVNGVKYWCQSFDADNFNVIFNNGGGAQTGDITGITTDSYFTYDGGTGYKLVDAGQGGSTPQPVDNTIHAYFLNTPGWGNVMCWAWIEGGENFTGGAWPGVGCTKLDVRGDNGEEIWEWVYTGSSMSVPAQIIFNNGNGGSGNQTADMPFTNGGFYNYDGPTTRPASFPEPIVTALATAMTPAAKPLRVYTMLGVHVATVNSIGDAVHSLPRGAYIINGKKYIVK